MTLKSVALAPEIEETQGENWARWVYGELNGERKRKKKHWSHFYWYHVAFPNFEPGGIQQYLDPRKIPELEKKKKKTKKK